ncbi:hypothetical protein [Methanoregula sp.]|uniref:hypothetical protein n=1 Tax=Methanoregula sp. TaxID=2052170 RepID=UPI002C108329|nr:hypothetical protein [Methanoregula sp.]HVP96117.1 hypothetical protein [Methanoregula sp.]
MSKHAWSIWAVLLLFSLFVSVTADTTPQAWTWNTYTGTYLWQVMVTEDQSGCGGGVYTNQYSVPIQYRGSTAVMGDVGHGSAAGTFTSGNILHISGRTVSDPPGSSDLSAYDVFFTGDCTAFTAKYTWDYSGPDGACSGTTTLNGASTTGCPVPAAAVTTTTTTPPPAQPPESSYAAMLTGPHADLQNYLDLCTQRDQLDHAITAFEAQSSLNQRTEGTALPEPAEITADRSQLAQIRARISEQGPAIEKEYSVVLVKDPNNFQANWDMAQLKKSEGQIEEGIGFANTAINSNLAGSAAEAMRRDFAEGNDLTSYPDPRNSNFVATIATTLPVADQNVYGTNIRQGSGEPSTLTTLKDFMMYADPKEASRAGNLVNQAVFGY